MNTRLTLGEKLKDLRIAKKLKVAGIDGIISEAQNRLMISSPAVKLGVFNQTMEEFAARRTPPTSVNPSCISDYFHRKDRLP